MSDLTAERLRELLHYDPETGVFTWKMVGKRTDLVGRTAGGLCKGYWRIKIDRRFYPAHRLAWLYTHGEWPAGELDHRDLDKLDNRIASLRPATRSQNLANMPRPKMNKSGFKGVTASKWGYRATVFCRGKQLHLGYFPTPEEAHRAYAAKAKEIYGEFARAA